MAALDTNTIRIFDRRNQKAYICTKNRDEWHSKEECQDLPGISETDPIQCVNTTTTNQILVDIDNLIKESLENGCIISIPATIEGINQVEKFIRVYKANGEINVRFANRIRVIDSNSFPSFMKSIN